MTLIPPNELSHQKTSVLIYPLLPKTVTFVEIDNPTPAKFVEAEEQTNSYNNSE